MRIETKHIIALLSVISCVMLLFAGCTKEPTSVERSSVEIRVQTRVTDDNVLNSDDKVNSIAVFVFAGSSSQRAEWTHFQTNIASLSSTSGQGYDWDVKTSLFQGEKTVYVFVNYDKVTLNTTITNATTRAQLEALIATNSAFVSTELFMAGKKTQTIGAAATQYIDVRPSRLASRVDIYPYKNSAMGSKVVVLQKITLLNQLRQSRVIYNASGNAMPVTPTFVSEEKTLNYTVPTAPSPVVYDNLNKLDSKGNIYTYCNIIAAASPTATDLLNAAKLQLDVTIDGEPRRYEGYVANGIPTVGEGYSLKQNAVYRVVAIFSENDLKVTYTVAGWTEEVIYIPVFQ